jgi:hypothetical protein
MQRSFGAGYLSPRVIAVLPSNVLDSRFDRIQARGDLIEFRRDCVSDGSLGALAGCLDECGGDRGGDDRQEGDPRKHHERSD